MISAVTLVELIRRERQKSLKEGRSSEKKAKSLVPKARDPLRWNLWRGILIEQRPRSSNINSDPFSENGTGNGTSKFILTNAPMKRLQRELKEISKYERARKLMETIKIIMSDISLFLCFSHKLKGPVTKELLLWITTCDQFFEGYHPRLYV